MIATTKVRHLLLPLALAGGLGACASNAVQPGIVSSTAAPPGVVTGSTPQATPVSYGGPAPSYGSPSYGAPVGASGRVVSVREVALQGGGPGAYRQTTGQGAMQGGLIGAPVGAIIGGAVSNTVGGSVIGLVLGAVGGAIAGTIFEGQQAAGRGIEVTVQQDDGQNITIAQRDDGDVQLGDRVQIVQDRQGVAKVVRDNSRGPD